MSRKSYRNSYYSFKTIVEGNESTTYRTVKPQQKIRMYAYVTKQLKLNASEAIALCNYVYSETHQIS